jgi:hypothetical protein
LERTDEHNISILITDGIISPGSGKDAKQYLVNQQIGIKTSIANYLLKEKNAAVIIYQLSSMFSTNKSKGIYFYDKENKKVEYNGQLPYYIWVIGGNKHLANLTQEVPESKFKGTGVQHVFSITTGNRQVKYALSLGTHSKPRDSKTIENLKIDSRAKKAKFAVNVDFSGFLLDEAYLLNSDNYENASKYKLEIKPSVSKGYTHTLYFSSDKITKGAVVVKLKIKLPDWIDGVNDEDGTRAIQGKTFGIKYQIDGVFDVFTDGGKNKYYTEIKININ